MKVKDRVYARLQESAPRFVSGEALAESLGVSRTAIWKAIRALMEEGLNIEARHRQGYRLLETHDRLLSEEYFTRLRTQFLGKSYRLYREVESTQDIAKVWAMEGAPHGAVVVSERQTKGRGRLSRSWSSPSGKGLWLSMILRPERPLSVAHQLPLLSAVAVARTLEHFGFEPRLKWPNDVILLDRKVAGMLIEGQGEVDRLKFAVLGIGINVLQQADDFPEALKQQAISLKMAHEEDVSRRGRLPARGELLMVLLESLETMLRLWEQESFVWIQKEWLQRAWRLHQTIILSSGRERVQGVFMGIDHNGYALLQTDQGVLTLTSGEIDFT